jgi:calcineurin-like phosphoesterase family protein
VNRLTFASTARLFFTGDTHFSHAKVIDYSRRPFPTVEAMDAAMIQRWNTRVSPEDTVFHLGDFAFASRKRDVEDLRARLHGKIHLIAGNHDHAATRNAAGWASVQPYLELRAGGTSIVLSHYAFEVWNAGHYGAWHLHGHSHGKLRRLPNRRRLDVGVDCWDFAPVSFAELAVEMAKVTFAPGDRHQEESDA